ncbi:MAG: HlyD family efflux transporter periplasmic adaptor subunit [Sphingobacteriales bacterium]|nr:HlyD family efflux transporter periplasmic adaptor subunit [Sphingobacteriales bacterium]
MNIQLLTPDIEKTCGQKLNAFDHVYLNSKRSTVRKWFWGIIIFLVIFLFLPWTQNIRSTGYVTTLRQEQRPQEINNIIPGRVVKWWVKEGDFVTKGDTIVQLAEVKDAYLDPNLLKRTQEQLTNKQAAVEYYDNKVGSTEQQIKAMENERDIKLNAISQKIQQVKRKIESDSAELKAANNELQIAVRQMEGATKMYEAGVIPLTEYERRKVQFQNVQAKQLKAENNYNNSKQDIIITQLDQSGTIQGYAEKISKAQGDKFQALSQIGTGQAEIAKLQVDYSNYRIRSGQYYVLAPQDGQVIKAKKAGINEMVKEGDMIVEIVPGNVEFAAEIWVRPMDLQLLNIGQKVRFMFDGYPAIVFSGWPKASYGTFGGKVVAIETNRSENGKFRVLVAEDKEDRPWPKDMKLGNGAVSFTLLKNVSIWYELWRNVNGFPPDYYKLTEAGKEKQKK